MPKSGTREEIRERRRRINEFRSQQFTAEEIFNSLRSDFPKLTLDIVYHDIEYIRGHAKEYILLEYLPNVGDEFLQAKTNIDWTIGQAVVMYYQGTEEKTVITYPNGTKVEKFVKKSRNTAMLRLIALLAFAKVNIINAGPVVANIQRILEENQRLKQEKNLVITAKS